MYNQIGDSESTTLLKRLQILSSMKFTKTVLKDICEQPIYYSLNENGQYSNYEVDQFQAFYGLSKDNVSIDIYSESLYDLAGKLIDLGMPSENVDNILVEPVIIQLKYFETRKLEMQKKIINIINKLTPADIYMQDDISFNPFFVTEKSNEKEYLVSEIWFGCTVELDVNITIAILNVFSQDENPTHP